MAVSIDLSKATYCGNEPGSIAEAMVRGVFNPIDLAEIGADVREDVVVKEKMYLVSMQENITRKRLACAEKTNSGALVLREKFLTPTNLQIWDQICAEDFGGKVTELARKKGFDINNLEGTQIETLIESLYGPIWKRDMLSIAQFGDTALDPAVSDLNKTLSTMDGLWKQIFAGVALTSGDPDKITRAVTVPGSLTANYTRDTFLPGLYFGQSELMKQVEDSEKKFVISGSLYENYLQSLMATPNIEGSFLILQDGKPVLYYNGIRVIANRMIDQKTTTLKHRGYLIVQGAFQIATDTQQETQVMKTWYSQDTDLNNVQVRYKLAVNYIDGDGLVVGY
jgi:hypothetical protein